MLNTIITGTEITASVFFICTAVSLLLGLASAALAMYKSRYSQSFLLTLAMLPAMVQMIIMMVNGNIGAGVAVAGAFGLIRFRSAPGSAQEIGMVFLATAIGLASYRIVLKDAHDTKAFMDELRTRNGNLNITCGKPVMKEAL